MVFGGERRNPEELLAKLEKLYGGDPIKSDVLGRRIALPSEIERATAAAQSGENQKSSDKTNVFDVGK